MPPKRQSTGSSGSASKKANTGADSSPVEPYKPPRSKRWAAVSGSANAEADYRTVWKDTEKAYSYITLCKASYADNADSEEEEDEDGDDEEGEKEGEEEEDGDDDDDDDDNGGGDVERLGPRCDRKRCVCFRPAAANPEHPWVISLAGLRKFNAQFIHASLRDPDNFDMYTYNDHAAYGALEVVQNLFLDFEEAAAEGRGEWREQWAVCEATVHFLLCRTGLRYSQIDDGECAIATSQLVGRMFLAMLAQLDDLGLVGDGTEVKSLGCTMAMYMALASDMRECSVLDEERKAYRGKKALQPDHFEDAILSYANKRGVTLCGPDNIEELMAAAVGEVGLPAKDSKDPWAWKAQLKKYMKNYEKVTTIAYGTTTSPIGGDGLDITTWTPAERKAKNFDNKDPIANYIKDIKNGLTLAIM
ncbi:hypothetical protein F5Y19DRAFT_32367 [Xylariaceae sp. FL1651]|nr:hypothetical protein F5Y19DRAFT_32367 [Xylariaceae sp. FL1651]